MRWLIRLYLCVQARLKAKALLEKSSRELTIPQMRRYLISRGLISSSSIKTLFNHKWGGLFLKKQISGVSAFLNNLTDWFLWCTGGHQNTRKRKDQGRGRPRAHQPRDHNFETGPPPKCRPTLWRKSTRGLPVRRLEVEFLFCVGGGRSGFAWRFVVILFGRRWLRIMTTYTWLWSIAQEVSFSNT